MADHTPAGPVELGADMDYAEHDRTYHGFVALAKYGALTCAAILISMAFGFFAGGGFFSSLILFVIIVAVGGYLLR
ncbi:MAG: aa3-type cytochrome c oxidase subunit IV [Mesorhizobium sp.]|nr:aa3-type cytochrome c oxidase subunit IV [Mesorhizobium sp.]MBN9241700.1 aa3-type cytochrome c oxidase subunit IV [Mesorhizobium sp.]MBN9272683.1 aa3-type cytochrome c oxidase subunit IV [Mesorhizobium sp.]